MTEGPDLPAVRKGLSALFPGVDHGAAEIVPLAGDASTRRYYRIRPAAGPAVPSLILMQYPDEVPPGEELPFLNVHRYLRRADIPVPAVLRSDLDAKLLFLEDAGDATLEDAVGRQSVDACASLYEQCIEILVRIQTEGTRALDGSAIPARLAFDVPKFAEEIEFFFAHAVREFGGIPLTDGEKRSIEDLFLPFLSRLAGLPRVLAHRDYHSRNVMVLSPVRTPGHRNVRLLDFQDARMGTVFYDLASLLRDAYVTLPDEMEEQLRYAWRHAATRELQRAAGDPGAFGELLDAAALQRNVKAIGTFGNQAHNRGKRFYLRFVPPTVEHLRRNFGRNRSMAALSARLLPLLEALAEKARREAP